MLDESVGDGEGVLRVTIESDNVEDVRLRGYGRLDVIGTAVPGSSENGVARPLQLDSSIGTASNTRVSLVGGDCG